MNKEDKVIFWEKVKIRDELLPRGKHSFVSVSRQAIVVSESQPFCKSCGRTELRHHRKSKHKYIVDKEEIFLDLEVDLPIGPGRRKAPIKAKINRVTKGTGFNQWSLPDKGN